MNKIEFIWKFCIVMTGISILVFCVGVYFIMKVPTLEWNLLYIWVPLGVGVVFNMASWIAKANLPKHDSPT